MVTNVVASQRAATKLVDIRYDVFDPEGDRLKVRVEISHDGGRSQGDGGRCQQAAAGQQ